VTQGPVVLILRGSILTVDILEFELR